MANGSWSRGFEFAMLRNCGIFKHALFEHVIAFSAALLLRSESALKNVYPVLIRIIDGAF
jgi:hypothetical protein